ncbi:hypothetical protein I5M27_18040 [Adhaeribacter sp. BT258]|uniref:Uncharacterized protein n=1 Tax=Adhaeribacter terrigena TaxID=2793070 RepID=A0ABS1C6A4_9BACT|nr:hypothetical protein [Adhaeribacter terrigena]MBK0404897.1 hypothetical protein [Adhaeribacter terrigena]
MIKRTGLLYLALIYLLIPFSSFADSKIKSDSINKATHKQEYLAKVKRLGLPYDEDFYYKYKVNLNKISELAKLGVNVKKDFLNTEQHYVEGNTLIAETVVKGTVLKLEYDTSRIAQYHSIYTVQVEEAYSGEPFRQIKIYLMSGKFGDNYISVSADPKIKVGDELLLFLLPFDYEEIEENKAKGFLNSFVTFPPFHPENFVVMEAFRIEGDKIYKDNDLKVGKLNRKEAKLKNIIKINDRKNFYSTRFLN